MSNVVLLRKRIKNMKGQLQKIKHKYPPHSGGRLAISAVPVVTPEQKISEVIKWLEAGIHKFESINYIYVVDSGGKLIGTLSIKDTLRQAVDTLVSAVMKKELIVAYPHTHQERIALLALKNNLKAIPVVDQQGIFLGVVPSDTILSVLYTESQEDAMHLAGVPSITARETVIDLPLKSLVLHRLSWLLLGLLGGVIAAEIVGLFEDTLQQNIILAAFIPLMMYMGGAVLAQTQAFFIRDLALNPDLNFGKYFIKQLAVTTIIAISISIAMTLISLIYYKDLIIFQIIPIALGAVIFSTMVTSLIIPYLFYKFKFDPADGSGPIATVLQDLMGVIIYFLIAGWLLS